MVNTHGQFFVTSDITGTRTVGLLLVERHWLLPEPVVQPNVSQTPASCWRQKGTTAFRLLVSESTAG